MSFWTDLLALAPDVVWKLDETAGPVADATGNGRAGTVVGAPILDQPTIIPNVTDTSMQSTNLSNGRIELADAAWMTATAAIGFWAAISYKPSAESFTAQRDIFGKRDMFQLWQETTGRITAYITPAWTALLSVGAAGILAAGTPYFIVLRKNATHWSLWINGVKNAEVAHAANPADSAGPLMAGASANPARNYRGHIQGMAYKVGAIADADILALYNSWNAPASAPPSNSPEVRFNVMEPDLVGVSWDASVDPEGGLLTYDVDYWDGAAWQSAAVDVAALSTDWVPPAAMRGDLTKVRVRATDPEGVSSGYTESAEFTILDLVPEDLVVTPGTEVTLIEWLNLGLNCDGEYWDGYAWHTLFTDQAIDSYEWDTSKRKAAAAKVRIRTIDDGGVESAWVESAPFVLTGKYYGNLWRALQSYASLELLWKLNDAAGLPQDSSGHGRHATNASGITYAEPSIVYNRPGDTSIRRVASGGFGSVVSHLTGVAWDDAIVTAILWLKPNLAGWGGSSSAILQLQDRYYIHGKATSGANKLGITAPGYLNQDLFDLVIGNTQQLAVVAVPGSNNIKAYLEAVQSADIAVAVAAGVTSLRFGSTESADTQYQAIALFSEKMDAMQLAWLQQIELNEPNELPSVPGAFVHPVVGEYDLAIPVEWGASVDPEGLAVQYKGEYQRGDGIWLPLFDWQSPTSYLWDTSLVVLGDNFQLRVKARDNYEEESDWLVSAAFNLVHARTAPNKPTLEWVWEADQILGFYSSEFSSPVAEATPAKSHWRFSTTPDMLNVIFEIAIDAPNYRLGYNPIDLDPTTQIFESLARNTDYWVDVAHEDNIGRRSPISNAVRGRTSLVHHGGSRNIRMQDDSPNARHGTYGIISGTDGSSFANHGPGGPSYKFPGHLLVGAPAGTRGIYELGLQGRGQWRVAAGDPKVIPNVRTDGLKNTEDIDPDSMSQIPGVFPMAPDFGIMVRLFQPFAVPRHRRYGIFAFIGNAAGMRMYMRDQQLIFEGYRYFNRSLFKFVQTYGPLDEMTVGTVPVGQLYTLRLWASSYTVWPHYVVLANPGETGYHRIQTGAGFIRNNEMVSAGTPWHWIDVGFDRNNTPNISAGSNTFPGAVMDFAYWNYPDRVADTANPPWIGMQTDDVTPEQIIASPGLQVYYRLDDPLSPTKPVLSVG